MFNASYIRVLYFNSKKKYLPTKPNPWISTI